MTRFFEKSSDMRDECLRGDTDGLDRIALIASES